MQEVIIEIIETLEKEHNKWCDLYNVDRDKGYINVYADRKIESFGDAIQIVKQVVKEYNGGWIPVEQGLPTTSKNCWVTVDINDKVFIRRDRFRNGEWEISMNKYVVAWQYEKRPKPYKSKGV